MTAHEHQTFTDDEFLKKLKVGDDNISDAETDFFFFEPEHPTTEKTITTVLEETTTIVPEESTTIVSEGPTTILPEGPHHPDVPLTKNSDEIPDLEYYIWRFLNEELIEEK